MKITMVLPPPNMTGGIRVAAIYALQLLKRGHTVFCVAPPRCQPTWREQFFNVIRGRGLLSTLRVEHNHFEDMKVPFQLLESYRPVTDADVPDADVVISTWWETTEWVQALSPSKGRKVNFLQHFELFDYLPAERVKATFRLPFRKIAVAQWIADIMARDFGDPSVTVVPNAVDLDQFQAPPRDKQPVPTVGVLYSSAVWKGCDISLKAVELARKQIPDLRLVSFGEEPVKAHLPLPAGATYTHRPPQDRIKDQYAACDVWLFGSRNEGFGLPILEAMACRTPVIGTPSGAAPDMLGTGDGILLQSFDPQEMADAIVRVCRMSSTEWKDLSLRAYTRVSSYRWEDAADRFEQALGAP